MLADILIYMMSLPLRFIIYAVGLAPLWIPLIGLLVLVAKIAVHTKKSEHPDRITR
jgi:hypothetical protein